MLLKNRIYLKKYLLWSLCCYMLLIFFLPLNFLNLGVLFIFFILTTINQLMLALGLILLLDTSKYAKTERLKFSRGMGYYKLRAKSHRIKSQRYTKKVQRSVKRSKAIYKNLEKIRFSRNSSNKLPWVKILFLFTFKFLFLVLALGFCVHFIGDKLIIPLIGYVIQIFILAISTIRGRNV